MAERCRADPVRRELRVFRSASGKGAGTGQVGRWESCEDRVAGRAHAQKEHHDIGVKLKLEISLVERRGMLAWSGRRCGIEGTFAPRAAICAWSRTR